jgi:hypothetical protein
MDLGPSGLPETKNAVGTFYWIGDPLDPRRSWNDTTSPMTTHGCAAIETIGLSFQ